MLNNYQKTNSNCQYTCICHHNSKKLNIVHGSDGEKVANLLKHHLLLIFNAISYSKFIKSENYNRSYQSLSSGVGPKNKTTRFKFPRML